MITSLKKGIKVDSLHDTMEKTPQSLPSFCYIRFDILASGREMTLISLTVITSRKYHDYVLYDIVTWPTS